MGYQSVFRRYEKKYLVTQEQYDRLAKVFAPRMERDRFSESTISNIYYDTPDFRLIRRSLDQPVYKEKLRLRTYRTPHADTEAFVEIKKKYIDEKLMDELKNIKATVKPTEIILVVDAMTGQDAVTVAQTFDEALGIDGVLMSKMSHRRKQDGARSMEPIISTIPRGG